VTTALTWPGVTFRTPTPDVRERNERLDRDFYVEEGLLGGDSRITIRRDSPEDAGFREIFVSLDGKQLVMLRAGESFTTEVIPGPHRLRAHNTLFWKTHELVLRPGEHARFTAINRAGWATFGLLFFLGAMPIYLTFERETGSVSTVRRAR
jgi:hypothetical protein